MIWPYVTPSVSDRKQHIHQTGKHLDIIGVGRQITTTITADAFYNCYGIGLEDAASLCSD